MKKPSATRCQKCGQTKKQHGPGLKCGTRLSYSVYTPWKPGEWEELVKASKSTLGVKPE